MNETLLDIRGLNVSFPTDDGLVKAVNTVDLGISVGETLALLGETGSGKTVLGMAILRLLQPNTIIKGEIFYHGRDLLRISAEEMRKVRGKEIAVVLQNSGTSLNPVYTVGAQIAEAVRLHQNLKGFEVFPRVVELLDAVKISDPERMAGEYPHRFSGGMRERVLIALALACDPSFLIADEPTKGLDSVTKQEILDLFVDVGRNRSVLFITHDIGAAAALSDRVAIMYAGEIIETGPTCAVLNNPRHPYTRGLLASLPEKGMNAIPGYSPSLISMPSGCRFSPRCALAGEECTGCHPQLAEVGPGHYIRCVNYDRGQ